MSYGPSLPAMWEQHGALVAKVLKGAKPLELPSNNRPSSS